MAKEGIAESLSRISKIKSRKEQIAKFSLELNIDSALDKLRANHLMYLFPWWDYKTAVG